MYVIVATTSYKKSLKKVSKWQGFYRGELDRVVDILAAGNALPKSHKDHSLSGNLKEFRECHIRGDLLLVYKIEKKRLILILANIGDHHSLFGK